METKKGKRKKKRYLCFSPLVSSLYVPLVFSCVVSSLSLFLLDDFFFPFVFLFLVSIFPFLLSLSFFFVFYFPFLFLLFYSNIFLFSDNEVPAETTEGRNLIKYDSDLSLLDPPFLSQLKKNANLYYKRFQLLAYVASLVNSDFQDIPGLVFFVSEEQIFEILFFVYFFLFSFYVSVPFRFLFLCYFYFCYFFFQD